MRMTGRALVVLVPLFACHGERAAPATPAPGPGPSTPSTPSPAPAPPPAVETAPALRLGRNVVPTGYALDLSLDPGREDFSGVITIDATVARATRTVWMHGKALKVREATVTPAGGAPLTATATLDGELLRLDLPAPLAAGAATIRLAYQGVAPVSLSEQEGLFRQAEGDATYLYSQFEAVGARRAFPCFDEPSFKVPWQVTLHVPKGMVALANAPAASERDDGDVHTVVFERTRPLPSYLVAVAVGPFELVDLGTGGANHVPMRIAVPRGRTAETRYARETTGQLLAALERYLGVPYPYAKLDQVAIPTFLGAMENPGLITYSASLLLAKPSEETQAWKRGFASVAAHELAHHWFGDLVTMVWWDDIWLNESFADFMADRVVDDWQPTWGTRLNRLQAAQGAFAADSLVSARKIHEPIRVHEDIIGAFDAISYAKGGAVLAMFEAFVERPVFQATLHDYLVAHAWGNATSADFIAALAAASRPEVSTSFATFLDQGGIPMVTLGLRCAGDRATLVLDQERFLPIGSKGSADQLWSIPMCVARPDGGAVREQCFFLSTQHQEVALDRPGCPGWVDGNAGGRGYYRVRYDGDLATRLLLAPEIDSVSRAAALFNLGAMVEGGHQPLRGLLIGLPVVARDRDLTLVAAAAELAGGLRPLVDDGDWPAYEAFLGRSFVEAARGLGWTARKDEPAIAGELRPRLLAIATMAGGDRRLVAEARRRAAAYLKDPTSLDPRLAAVALSAATHGGDDALARGLDARFRKSKDHNHRAVLLAAMVASRLPAVRAAALAKLATGELTLEELIMVVFSASEQPVSRAEMYAFVTGHLDEVLAALPFLIRPAVVRIAAVNCDDAHRAELDTIFAPKVKDLPGGDKELREATEAMELCIARRKAAGPELAAFLRNP